MKRRTLLKAIGIGMIAQHQLFAKTTAAGMFSGKKNRFNHLLWFRKPGKYWNSQALHIGNGGLGISFLGGIAAEQFAITDKTLWTGGPGQDSNYNYGIRPGGKNYLKEIRALITSNDLTKLKKADKLVSEHFMGDTSAFGHFSSYGKLSLLFSDTGNAAHYTRSLDLSSAVANTAYEINGIKYLREYFCSYPDNIGVIRIAASQKGSVSATLKWAVFQKDFRITYQNNIYELTGTINGNQQKFSLKLYIRHTGGRVSAEKEELVIDKTDELLIVIASATAYDPDAPGFKGKDPAHITRQTINKIKNCSYEQLKRRHIADYRRLYDRLNFNLQGNAMAEALPTDERWAAYREGRSNDAGLKVLYFNLSRYLLIAASRKGFLPANLQGGWNMWEAAQWSGNYQSNINVQMNYSSAHAVALDECLLPYISWIKRLAVPGAAVAKAYYDSDGWVSHTVGNIWGYAAPGSELIWGMYPMGAAWHCHYLWQHFVYTQDISYLKNTAYPLLKDATRFWLQNLIPYKGKLIVAPSVSAEHGAYIRKGKLVASGSSFGEDIGNIPCAFQDVQLLTELFDNTMAAARTLQTDPAFISAIETKRMQLMPLKIGRYGQLQEWEEDIDDPACNHRHIAHLYAVWPAKQIGADDGAFTAAAKKTLALRGEARQYKPIPHSDIYTAGNWSLALRMICYIRLHDAEKANQLFNDIIRIAGFENLLSYNHVPAGDSRQNDEEYFTTPEGSWYPVWQIDTSLALAGFMSEMLLQTAKDGTIHLLPVLPEEWQQGSIKGLKAAGNLTVDLEWENGKVMHYKFYAAVRKTIRVKINGVIKKIHV